MRAYREPRQPPSPLRYAALARPTTAPAHSRTVPTALAAAFRADTVTPLPPASTLTQVTGFRYAALAPYLHEPPTTGPPAGHIRATRAPLRPLACPTRHDERHSRVTEMPTPRRQLRFRRSRFSVASPWHEPAANSRASARTRRKLPRRGTNQPQAHPPRHEPAASSRAAARISRKPTHLGTKPPRASAPQHPTAAGCSVRARNRRGHARFVQIRLHPSRRPPHCRRSRASDMQRWHHICTNRPPPAPFGPHTGSPDLHGRAPSTRSRLTARIAMSWATRSRHRRRDHDSRPRSRSSGRCDCRGRCECRGRRGRHEPRLRYSTGLGDVGTHANVSRPPSQPRNAMPVITPQTMKPA